MFSIVPRVIAALLCVLHLWFSSYPAWADALSDQAAAGQAFGMGAVPTGIGTSTGTSPGSTVTIAGPNGITTSLDIKELFPGLADPVAVDHDQLLENEDAIQAGTTATINDLTTAATPTGEAFRTVFEGVRNGSRPDLSNDPIWGQTDTTYAGVFDGTFSDCTKTTTTISQTNTNYIHEYHTCERLLKPAPGKCTVNHDYTSALVNWSHGDGSLQSCGDGCLDIWVGKVGDNYLPGACTIHEQEVVFDLINPQAVTKATLVQAVYDDYQQIWLDNAKVWNGPNENFPPETPGPCELGTSWNQAIAVDVTSQFRTPGQRKFKIRTSVTGAGEGYARMRLEYDPSKIVINDTWGPQECLDQAQMAGSEFCSVSYTCTNDPSSGGNCATMESGVTVCNQHLAPSPLPGISNICTEVTVTSNGCDYNVGQMDCWIDAQGVQRCPYNPGTNTNSCAALEANPACGFIKSVCVDGARDSKGTCFAYEDTYDCPTAIPTTVQGRTETVTCPGDISCMGGDCVTHKTEENNSFGHAAGVLQAAQFAMQDLSCPDPSDTSGGSCTVFKGDAMECKKAMGGWQDCCEAPVSIGLQDYMDLLMAANKIAAAKNWLVMDNPVLGAHTAIVDGAKAVYNAGQQAVVNTWNTMTGAVTRAWESIAGTAGDVAAKAAANAAGSTVTEAATTELGKTIIQKTIDELTAKLAEWVYQTFGEVATNMMFSGAGSAAGGAASDVLAGAATTGADVAGEVSLGGQVGAVLGPIMWAYTAYVIANLLVQVIWECEPEEFELAAKKDLKVCTHLGSYCKTRTLGGACIEKRESYCCYESPLSRIIMEQAGAQFGNNYGDIRNPSCKGLTIAQLGQVDWKKVDLSEWMAILQLTGHLADVNSQFLTPEGLTGTGNVLMIGEDRSNVIERTTERINGNSTLLEDRQYLRQEMYLSQPPPAIPSP